MMMMMRITHHPIHTQCTHHSPTSRWQFRRSVFGRAACRRAVRILRQSTADACTRHKQSRPSDTCDHGPCVPSPSDPTHADICCTWTTSTCRHSISTVVCNVSQWQNLRHLGESLGGAEGLLAAVSFKKATKGMGGGRVANARWEWVPDCRGCNTKTT